MLVKRLALLTLLLAAPAFASAALRMDVPALTAAATDVVDGKVVSSAAVWTGDHRRIVTHVVVEVREAWKGSASGRDHGGPARRRARRHRAARLGRRGAPSRRAGGALPRADRARCTGWSGLAQGVYRVFPVEGTGETRAVPASSRGWSWSRRPA